ncbi:MAG: DNA-3-methyladenine glycosylase 2 family protein [Caldilineaceae bacterium]|nr:DNA-3-methyladenine glycosylase 2 family protein [Caldilineaceae bacterium]
MLDHPSAPLTDARLAAAVMLLAARDPALAAIFQRLGTPPLWAREPGFPTLIWIILEQQVSLASARAAFLRLAAQLSPLTPQAFLQLDDETLRAIGFSRQKSSYGRHLAQAIVAGHFDLAGLAALPDEAARTALMARKGIGAWTADIYLLMGLCRPDIWPAGDLALQVALQRIQGWTRRPTIAEMEALAEPWRPWRAVAARLLWHSYLQERSKALG